VKSDVDAAIVGAGHNGLACGAYLARAGLSVLVLEARSIIGGASATVDALGARFNICNCDHVMVRNTPIVEELGLTTLGLDYLDVEPGMVNLMWDGGKPWALFKDVDRTLESISMAYPSQVEAYKRYLEVAMPIARIVLNLSNEIPTRSAIGRLMAKSPPWALVNLVRWSRRSATDVLRSFFTEEGLCVPAIVNGPASNGASPDSKGTGLGALGYAVRHLVGTSRPRGGSGELAGSLRRALEQHNGQVRLGSQVLRVLVEGRRVWGVELDNGEKIKAPIVVSAIDPRTALLSWFTEPPSELLPLVERARRRRQIDGYESKLDAVVSKLPRFKAYDQRVFQKLGVGEPLVATTYLSGTIEEIRSGYRLMAAGRMTERLMHFINVPSVLDSSMRVGPAGAHVFSLETLYTPLLLADGVWAHSTEPERWLEKFSTLVEPGFLDGVQRWRVVTPDIYETDFHLPRGVPPAFKVRPLDLVLGRDPELIGYRTELDGFYLTGSGTYPGAGVWGASGRNTATAILRTLDAR
jgi:phytoene dehydrogenase-like protein